MLLTTRNPQAMEEALTDHFCTIHTPSIADDISMNVILLQNIGDMEAAVERETLVILHMERQMFR